MSRWIKLCGHFFCLLHFSFAVIIPDIKLSSLGRVRLFAGGIFFAGTNGKFYGKSATWFVIQCNFLGCGILFTSGMFFHCLNLLSTLIRKNGLKDKKIHRKYKESAEKFGWSRLNGD